MGIVGSVHVVVNCFFLQAFEDRYFRKREISWAILSASCGLISPVESKPNSKITKMKMIGVKLMASSIIDKKSQRRGRRAEPQATGLRRQTRTKHASQSFGRLHLSSCYFLKRSKIDISCSSAFPRVFHFHPSECFFEWGQQRRTSLPPPIDELRL